MYKLSKLAEEDFANVYDYTLINFGEAQADDYTEAMESILKSIVASPLLGRGCPEIADGIYRIEYRMHVIFYRIRPQDIFILRILHHKMEPLLHFSDV